MSIQHSPTAAAHGPATCTIAQSSVYEERLVLSPIPLVPGTHDLSILSRLDTAKDRQALHTRHRVVLSTDDIERIHRLLSNYLKEHKPSLRAQPS